MVGWGGGFTHYFKDTDQTVSHAAVMLFLCYITSYGSAVAQW